MMGFTLSSDERSRLSERRRELLREQRQLNVRRFFRNGHAVAGALIILVMILLAVFAPLLAPADPLAQTVANRFAKPGTAGYLLGADKLGRDLLSRIIYGARVSMIVGVSSSLCSMLFGMIIGLYACYYKAIDNILMRICDGLSAIPSILLAIALMAVLGQSLFNVILALSIVYIPRMARISRSAASTSPTRDSSFSSMASSARVTVSSSLFERASYFWILSFSRLISRRVLPEVS